MDEFKLLTLLTLIEECKTLESLQNDLVKTILVTSYPAEPFGGITYKKLKSAILAQASKLGVINVTRWYSCATRYVLSKE